MRTRFRVLASIACALSIATSAQVADLGKGSFLTNLPAGQPGPIDTKGATALPRVAEGAKGPYPTNDWWSSILFPRDPSFPFGKPLFAWPLAFHARSGGWEVGAPDPAPSLGSEFHYGQIPALVAKVDGLAATQVKAVGWTDWTVTARLDDGARSLDATIGHGLPYAYFASEGGDALVSCMTDPVVWAGSGTDAVGITVAGNHYGLFAPTGSGWTLSGRIFRSDLAGKGRWSVAVLPAADAAVLARFRRSAFAIPTQAQVSWKIDPTSGTVASTYRIRTTALEGTDTTTIMALFRHQWTRTRDVNTAWSYVSPRGAMKVVDGNAFTTVDALPAILPHLPAPASSDAEAIRRELKQAAAGKLLDPEADTYWAGKGLQRANSLVDLADQLGETRLRDSLILAMKVELESWFTARAGAGTKNKKLFAYDPRWGSLIGLPASYGSDAELNDHHFHYGYFVQAAATVARFDKNWAKDWGPMVDLIIRDANGARRDDALFPFLRHFDIYDGHSWASGHAYFDAGNNNESSSEGMNYSAALALWGMATGNDTLRDAGLWMAATEMRAVEQYWWDVDAAVFPNGFKTKAVGMVWGNGGAHATWFSGEPECIHGINVLPFTSSSLQWTRYPERARQELAEMHAEKTGGAFTEWRDVLMAYRAIGDASGAWTEFDRWDGAGAEGGVPKAWYRRWIALLRDAGNIDTSVRANHASAAVLLKESARTYIAWNPGSLGLSVEFSDGHVLQVAANSMASDKGSVASTAKRNLGTGEPPLFHTFGTRALATMGSAPVVVRSLEGKQVFRGPASSAAKIAGDRIWIVERL